MLTEEDSRMQEELARAVTTFHGIKVPNLCHSERLAVYQQSFRGRVVAGLVEAILGLPCTAFSTPFVSDVVARYFATHPPECQAMEEALAGLPDFISARGSSAALFADLVRVSLEHWRLLVGSDPGQLRDCEAGVMIASVATGEEVFCPAAFVLPLGAYDLEQPFDAWQNEEAACDPGSVARGILLIKIDFATIVGIGFTLGMAPLIARMLQGQTADDALRELSDAELAAMSEDEVFTFLVALRQIRVTV